MKKGIFAVVGLVSALATSAAFAVGPWSNLLTIATIEVDSIAGGNGTETYLSFTSTPSGKPACGTASQYLATGTADHVKAVTATATAAQLSGRQVKVYWTGTCTGSYANFMHISLE